MASVSARSYLAAGLATAMAGAAVIGPMAAQRQIHLPNVLSANVKLSSAETALAKTEMAVANLAINAVTDVAKAGQQKAQGGSASPAAAPAATSAVSAPEAKTATVHALASIARAVDARPSAQHVTGAAAVQPNSAASAAVAALNPSAIIDVPLLVADIGLDIAANLSNIPTDLLFDISTTVFDVATHQGVFQQDLATIGNDIVGNVQNLISNVQSDIQAIGDALGFDANGFAADARAKLAAGATMASRVAGAVSLTKVAPKSVEKPGAVHAQPDVKGDTTEADTTKADTKTADTAKADTKTAHTAKADAANGDTAKPSAHSASTVSSTSTASNAKHSTASSAAKASSTQSGTSAQTHRGPSASTHAGASRGTHSGGTHSGGTHGGGKHGK